MPAPQFNTYLAKVLSAAREADPDASAAQHEARNAKVGKVFVHGLEVSIRFPKGAVRGGVDKDGNRWRRVMRAHYGHVNRTEGRDGKPIDCFVGDHPQSQLAFVISQLEPDGNLEEHKIVLGCRNVDEAKTLYLAHYPAGWADSRMGEVRGYFMKDLKAWLASCHPHATEKSADVFCRKCHVFYHDHDTCPECEPRKKADLLPGGRADDLPDRLFDTDELRRGRHHEREHTNDPRLAKEIAKDHLVEDEGYYDKLEKIEKAAGPLDALVTLALTGVFGRLREARGG